LAKVLVCRYCILQAVYDKDTAVVFIWAHCEESQHDKEHYCYILFPINKKLFEVLVLFKRRDFVVVLDADDNNSTAVAPDVQLVVHYRNVLSYMLIMNQICAQKAETSLW
jgi:hypothetical protein